MKKFRDFCERYQNIIAGIFFAIAFIAFSIAFLVIGSAEGYAL